MGFARVVGLLAAVALLATACSPRFNWREIRPPEAGFVVALPDKPQSVARDIAFEHPGGAVRAEMTMLSTGVGATLFAVGTARLPEHALDSPAALAATLAWFREGLARNVRGASPAAAATAPPGGLGQRSLRAAEGFSVAGQSADGRAAQLAARLYVVDDRLFQLVLIGAEGEVPPQALETFFDSFRLVP